MAFNKLPVYILFFIVTRIEIIWGDNITTSIKTLSESCYKSLAKEDNLIFSPFSVHAILSLVYEAASGKTASHLQEVLNLPNAKKTADDYKAILDNLNSTEKTTINLANKIYLPNNFKLKSKFRWTAKAYFNAGVENISFTNSDAAAENINNWVNEKTNNKIQQIFNANDFNDQTKGILLSAIYFKGNWSYSFAKAMTYTEKFYISQTKSISHPMMHMIAPFGYTENLELDAKILKMSYGDKRFAMYIILPNVRMGIKTLEKKLSSLDVNHLQLSTMKKVEVAIPKFKIQSTSELSRPLQKIGLGDIFSGNANFSKMIESEQGLKFQKVIQKAFIEVDEEGTEAAAATGAVVSFIADHPFVFYITFEGAHPAKAILFVGKVVEPHY